MTLFALVACTGGDGSGVGPDGSIPVVSSIVYDDTSDRDGYMEIEVEVTDAVDVFQVVAKRKGGLVSTDYLYGPDGETILDWEDWYDSKYSLTECFFPSEHASTFNWPVRAEDGPLSPGTYTVAISTLTNSYNYSGNEDVEVEILTRSDANVERGSLRAVIAYASGVRDDADVVAGVEAAADYWKDIYGDAGISLTYEFSDIDVDPELPDTYEGVDEYVTWLESHGERVVLVVVGESIADDETLYGEAGGIPGPYTATEHSAVEVSWLANAGSDGRFSDADILLFGETMAHEVGHYLGMFHPVEWNYDYWDALDDTDDCTSWGTCDRELGENLMYPYPVCESMSTTSCVRQSDLTDDQLGVAQRYVGVE